MKTPPVPVTVIGPGGAVPLPGPGVAVLTLTGGAPHAHDDNRFCPACAAQGDVRAKLYDLLESARQGLRPQFLAVLVDAREAADFSSVIDAIEGRLPARAMRDHVVARRFRLVSVLGTEMNDAPLVPDMPAA